MKLRGLQLLALIHCGLAASNIRLNHVQTLHAHNSYHRCPVPSMVALYESPIGKTLVQSLGPRLNPGELSYGHESLLTLVKDLGVRSLELDLLYDPIGGHFGHRAGPKIATLLRAYPNTTDQQGGEDLFTPGFKILHIPDLDFQSSCDSLMSCLRPIAEWSRDNPTHTPLFIVLEFKSWDPRTIIPARFLDLINMLLMTSQGLPTNLSSTPIPEAAHLHTLEQEILSVFQRSQIVTPDDFRETYVSLQDRIAQAGWPVLDALRGRVLFRAMGAPAYVKLMQETWPEARGGLLFLEDYVGGFPYTPDTNTVFASTDRGLLPHQYNLTVGQQANLYRAAIERVIKPGTVMLRVSADVGTRQARDNFQGFANAAAAGGAHFIHTDYPAGSTSKCGFESPYTVPLQQVQANTWDDTSLSSANTTRWMDQSTAILASVCNPVSTEFACTTWPQGLQPLSTCTCYSLQ